MDELDFLKQYTDAAKESTNRTRHILLVMIVASILLFAAVWNSRISGWGYSRLVIARAAQDILKHDQDQRDWKNEKYRPVDLLETLENKNDRDRYERAKKFLSMSRVTSEQAEPALFWAQQVRAEQVGRIQVPVLGISIDVNDVGMLGGFSLTVLLIWANYSLWHHNNNLRLALDFATEVGEKDLKDGRNRLLYHTYQNLAMSQVLTIPPRPKTKRIGGPGFLKTTLRSVSKLLYVLPLFVQAAIVWHDWGTKEIGNMINPEATRTVLITGRVFLALILVLTLMTLFMWATINRRWWRVANSL